MNAAFLLNAEHFRSVYGEESVERIARQVRLLSREPLTAAALKESPPNWLSDVDILFTGWGAPQLDAHLVSRMPRLQVVFHAAGSVRTLVSDACWVRGVVFSNAAALNAIPVIEFTVGAIFLSFKRAWHHARAVRIARTYVPLCSLSVATGVDATVGLWSLGLIGRGVAERLRSSDVRVIAHDPVISPAEFAALGVESVSLDELFARSDVLSLHAPFLTETAGLIDRRLLDKLPLHASFINTARGGLVREADLISFLCARPDVQAILDVLEPEPPVRSSAMYDLPNVFITPHIAGSIGPEHRRLGRSMVEELERFVRGEPLKYEVIREELANRA